MRSFLLIHHTKRKNDVKTRSLRSDFKALLVKMIVLTYNTRVSDGITIYGLTPFFVENSPIVTSFLLLAFKWGDRKAIG